MSVPFHAANEVKQVREMLSRGSTRGMVVQHLRDKGFDDQMLIQVIGTAERQVNKAARVRSVFVIALGLSLMLGGLVLTGKVMPFGLATLVKVAIAVSMFGLMVCIYGVHGLLTRRV